MNPPQLNINVFLLLSLFIVVSCTGGEEASEQTSANQQDSLEAFWNPGDLPLTIAVSSQLSDDERTSISSSLDEWDNAVPSVSFFRSSLASVSDPKHSKLESYRDNTLGVYIIDEEDSLSDPSIDSSKALAVTQFYATVESGSQGQYYRIIHADIFVNKRYYEFSTAQDETRYDFPSVVVHEFGHLLGLGHQSFSVDSVMNPSISKATEKREIFPVDEDSIYSLYEDKSSGVVSGASRGLASLEPSQNKEVVRIVSHLMPNGTCEHYQNDVLTHVHSEDVTKLEYRKGE